MTVDDDQEAPPRFPRMGDTLTPMVRDALEGSSITLTGVSFEIGVGTYPTPRGPATGVVLMVTAQGYDLAGPGRTVGALAPIGGLTQAAVSQAVQECCDNLRLQKIRQRGITNGQAP